MTAAAMPEELYRAAREAESQGRYARATRLRHKASAIEQAAAEVRLPVEVVAREADPSGLALLTSRELMVEIERCFIRGQSCLGELARRGED